MSDPLNQHLGHVDVLNLTVSLCLCYTICIALVRLWIRRGAFGIDDVVVLVATAVTLSHTGTSYIALADGLGKPWNRHQDRQGSGELERCMCIAIYPRFKTMLSSLQTLIAGVVTFITALYISNFGAPPFLAALPRTQPRFLAAMLAVRWWQPSA
jgi:hypothetical protein